MSLDSASLTLILKLVANWSFALSVQKDMSADVENIMLVVPMVKFCAKPRASRHTHLKCTRPQG